MSATVKNNFQEYDPRHRLTGAVVLILLAIILLPMLLSKDQDVQEPEIDPVVMEVTKDGKKVFVSRISSATAPNENPVAEGQQVAENASNGVVGDKSSSVAKDSSKSSSEDQVSSALFKPMSSADVKKSAATKSASGDKKTSEPTTKKIFTKEPAAKSTSAKTTTTKTTAPKTTTTSAPKKTSTAVAGGEWMLQVGVFSQSANANNKVAELKKKGFDAKSSTIKTSKGTVTKVWIGPFKDRSSAEKMQERLQHKTRQRGMVVKK